LSCCEYHDRNQLKTPCFNADTSIQGVFNNV
jgi:hypothetical protein